MVKDLLQTAQLLETELRKSSPMMQALKPKFVLTGSVAEGTRIGLGNELDMTLRFEGWMIGTEAPFKFVESEPFYLHKGHNIPKWLEWYFVKGRFQLERFKRDLLDLVDSALATIFLSGCNPPRLRIRPNVQKEKRTTDRDSRIGKPGPFGGTLIALSGPSTTKTLNTYSGYSLENSKQPWLAKLPAPKLPVQPKNQGNNESRRPKEEPQGCYHCAEVHIHNGDGISTYGIPRNCHFRGKLLNMRIYFIADKNLLFMGILGF